MNKVIDIYGYLSLNYINILKFLGEDMFRDEYLQNTIKKHAEIVVINHLIGNDDQVIQNSYIRIKDIYNGVANALEDKMSIVIGNNNIKILHFASPEYILKYYVALKCLENIYLNIAKQVDDNVDVRGLFVNGSKKCKKFSEVYFDLMHRINNGSDTMVAFSRSNISLQSGFILFKNNITASSRNIPIQIDLNLVKVSVLNKIYKDLLEEF